MDIVVDFVMHLNFFVMMIILMSFFMVFTVCLNMSFVVNSLFFIMMLLMVPLRVRNRMLHRLFIIMLFLVHFVMSLFVGFRLIINVRWRLMIIVFRRFFVLLSLRRILQWSCLLLRSLLFGVGLMLLRRVCLNR